LRRDEQAADRDQPIRPARLAVYNAPFTAGSTAIPIPAPAGVGYLGPLGFSADGTACSWPLVRPVSSMRRPGASVRAARDRRAAGRDLDRDHAAGRDQGQHLHRRRDPCPDSRTWIINVAATWPSSRQLRPARRARAPLLVIPNPFDDLNRLEFPVVVGDVNANTHGRGTGSVRFLPPDCRCSATVRGLRTRTLLHPAAAVVRSAST
jgi:hypothetical protein